MIGAILFLAMVASTNLTWATPSSSCSDMTGSYVVDGSVKLPVNFPNYASATITLPKLANLGDLVGEVFYFYGDGTFGDQLLCSAMGFDSCNFAPWEQYNNCTFAIDLSGIASYLLDMLSQYGVDAEVAGSTTVTGKIASNGTNSGKFNLKINIDSPVEGNLSLSVSFKGYPVAYDSLQKKNKSSLKPEIKNFLSSVLSMISRKGTALKK